IIRQGREQAVVTAIADYLMRHQWVLEFSQVESDSLLTTHFSRLLEQKGWHLEKSVLAPSPYIPLSGHTWDSFLDSLSSSMRGNVRKKMRKMERDFAVRLERVSDESRRQQAMSILVELHLKRWNDNGGSNAMHRDELIEFHEAWSSLALREGWL